MKYTTNSNNFHLHIKLELNGNYLIKKKLIIGNNVSFKTRKNFNLYRAYPDVEEGSRFMRDMFFEISKSDIYKLCQRVKKLI